MKDVSNKTILSLLVVALVVTVIGTTLSVTQLAKLGSYSSISGAQTSEAANVTLTIEGTVSLDVSNNELAFGTGYFNSSCNSVGGGFQTHFALASNDTWNGSAGSQESSCFLNATGIEPTGLNTTHNVSNNGTVNVNVSVAVDSNIDNASFLCGSNNESSCSSTAGAQNIVNITSYADPYVGTVDLCSGGTLLNAWTTLLNESESIDLDVCTLLTPTTANGKNVQVAYLIAVESDAIADGSQRDLLVTYTAEAK